MLFRKIWDTSFYRNPKTCHLVIHLLLRANFKSNKIIFNQQELKIERGSFITSIGNLSEETGLSLQNVRTSLKTLENIHFLTRKPTNQFTLISIQKYEDYQNPNIPSNKPLTNHQQTTNKRPTTNNKDNKDNKDKKDKIYINILNFWNFQNLIKHNPKGSVWEKVKKAINGRIAEGYNEEEIKIGIKSYSDIIKDEKCYFKHRWTLTEFLGRGFEKFKNPEMAKLNYKAKSKGRRIVKIS